MKYQLKLYQIINIQKNIYLIKYIVNKIKVKKMFCVKYCQVFHCCTVGVE